LLGREQLGARVRLGGMLSGRASSDSEVSKAARKHATCRTQQL
jgi:hypothetical protein